MECGVAFVLGVTVRTRILSDLYQATRFTPEGGWESGPYGMVRFENEARQFLFHANSNGTFSSMFGENGEVI